MIRTSTEVSFGTRLPTHVTDSHNTDSVHVCSAVSHLSAARYVPVLCFIPVLVARRAAAPVAERSQAERHVGRVDEAVDRVPPEELRVRAGHDVLVHDLRVRPLPLLLLVHTSRAVRPARVRVERGARLRLGRGLCARVDASGTLPLRLDPSFARSDASHLTS